MKKEDGLKPGLQTMIAIVLLAAMLGGLLTGCCHAPSGSREFRPGEGWVPTPPP